MLKTKIVAALALATAGLAQAQVPSSIVLLPFCDTLYDLSVKGGLAKGMWDSDCDGTAETTMAGSNGRALSTVPGKGVFMAANTYPLYGVTEGVMVHDDGTWMIIFSDGGLLAQGTWVPLTEKPTTGRPVNAR